MKADGSPCSYLEAKYLRQRKQGPSAWDGNRLGMFKELERLSVAGIQETWGKWNGIRGHRGTVAAGQGKVMDQENKLLHTTLTNIPILHGF